MRVIGLTGGMAAGKSTVAGYFRRFSVPVFDADLCVRSLQGPYGKALPLLEKEFPGIVRDHHLDRAALRSHLLEHPRDLKKLEAIMHPLVKRERRAFIRSCRRQGRKFCVLDIPLLWETGADRDCDAVLVVHAPLRTRLARLEARFAKEGKMSVRTARQLMKRQLPEEVKCRRADFVIRTGLSRFNALRQVVPLDKQFQASRLHGSGKV
ncbi:dephospho-CoA kinase [Acetobacteraceae bacterium ESL0709]|nr:dephospho-CoA kinase [Acetobacteraceae bacterium ESL0697]MDF7678260.1 dephospho-CoA kinase [Acetobacteraceae bacterium ESL0709]